MSWAVIPPQKEGWYWIEFINSIGATCRGIVRAYSHVKGGPIDTAFWDGENVPVVDERIQRWAGPVSEPAMKGKTVATMPEIHFRLVAVASDGREITFPSAELHGLGEFKETLFLRFKENANLTQSQVAAVLKEIHQQFDGKPVVILPWYIDLIKLVPVR